MVDPLSNREKDVSQKVLSSVVSYTVCGKSQPPQKTFFLHYWLKLDHRFASKPITSKEKWSCHYWIRPIMTHSQGQTSLPGNQGIATHYLKIKLEFY